jgi:hypothetical protein
VKEKRDEARLCWAGACGKKLGRRLSARGRNRKEKRRKGVWADCENGPERSGLCGKRWESRVGRQGIGPTGLEFFFSFFKFFSNS